MRSAIGLITLLVLVSFAGTSQALPLTNPFPGIYGPDLNDSGQFNYTNPAFVIEEFDLGAGLALGGSRFGFYFVSAPGTLIEIFDALDEGPGTSAIIDFGLGAVLDADDGNSLQDLFVTLPGPIGFWLEPSAATQGLFGAGTLYTEAYLNPGGVDHVSTLPSLFVPGALLLAFGGTAATGADVPLAFDILLNLEPVVPEPASFALLLMGCCGLGVVVRRRRRAID